MNIFNDFWKYCMLEEALEEEEDDEDYDFDEDYDLEEDYEEEYEEDGYELEEPFVEDETPRLYLTETEILINSMKEAAYTEKRRYDAEAKLQQLHLDRLNGDEREWDKIYWDMCEFILESDATAAKYLTMENGFIYAQAIRENFTLPIELPKEDRKSVMGFLDIFLRIMKVDMKLAVDVWVWCVKTFCPYAQFMQNEYDLYWGVNYHIDEYPSEFREYVTKIMCTDMEFSQQFFGNTPNTLVSYEYIDQAVKMGHYEGAAEIERIAKANPQLKDFEVEMLDELIQRAYTERKEDNEHEYI